MRNKIKTKSVCLHLIFITRNIQTFLITFIFTFFKLALRSILTRSIICIVLYLFLGIDTAHAWVDWRGIEHTEGDGSTRIKVTHNAEQTVFKIHNQLTNEIISTNYKNLQKILNIASVSENGDEFNEKWLAKYPNPPSMPTEDPSNNPKPRNDNTIPPMPDIHPILIDPTNPPQWESYCKALNSFGGIRSIGDKDLYNIRLKYGIPVSYDNRLEGQHPSKGYNPNLKLELRLHRSLGITPIDEMEEFKESKHTHVPKTKVDDLLSSAPTPPQDNSNNSHTTPKPKPVKGGSAGDNVIALQRKLIIKPNIPPLPTNTTPPVLTNIIPPVPTNITPPVFTSEPPRSLSIYYKYFPRTTESISNIRSVFEYLGVVNKDVSILPTQSTFVKSVGVAIMFTMFGQFSKNYFFTATKALTRNVPGFLKREELVDWYLENPFELLSPWDKVKWFFNQPCPVNNTVLDHFNGNYLDFIFPVIHQAAPFIVPAMESSILCTFPIIGTVSQTTGITPIRLVTLGTIATTQAIATASGTTIGGLLSWTWGKMTAFRVASWSTIGNGVSWLWKKCTSTGVKAASKAIKSVGNALVSGLQTVGAISAQTAQKINEFRDSWNKTFQKWLLGSSGSAIFSTLFGSRGKDIHTNLVESLSKLDQVFPWLEFFILLTLGLYLLRILWGFRKIIFRIILNRLF